MVVALVLIGRMGIAVERVSAKSFRVGVAELNGHLNSMEDAHIIYPKDSWGFFGASAMYVCTVSLHLYVYLCTDESNK